MSNESASSLAVLRDTVVPIEMILSTAAKVLCSAVFVSGREPEEAFRHSALWSLKAQLLPDALLRHARWRLDRADPRVDISIDLTPAAAADLIAAHRAAHPGFEADWAAETARLVGLRSVTRSAQFTGAGQGSIIIPRDGDRRLHFEPREVRRGPASSAGWPGQGAAASADEATSRSREGIAKALAASFADPEAFHAAVVVVHGGQIVGEQYAAGIGPDMPLESWSMGKSVMGTLISLLIGRGALELDARAPIAAWDTPSDPRRAITLRHLLNMSSGLRCTGQDDARSTWRYGLPEHFLPYAEALGVAEYATRRPLEFPPDTVGRYRNCDPLSLAAIFHDTVSKLGGDPLTWAQTEFFDRLGMRGLILETDRWGRFIVSGFDYGTARDWARIGLLYLRDGVWEGSRVLPAGWVEFARAAAPAWKNREYGAQIWLNSMKELALPPDTYYFAGGGGQYVFVVPSADLVIVRMGHTRGWEGAKDKVNVLLNGVTAALADKGAQ
jgi:CubicO group peptidase (beta-lactamase class C family)